jgi:hypothetical protein
MKWFDLTKQRIESGELAESVIRALRMRVARALNASETSERAYKHCSVDQASALCDLIEAHKPSVSAEQARKGADWLYSQVFTKSGATRRTETAQQFTDADKHVLRECFESPRFSLVRFEIVERGRYVAGVFPVYRCHGNGGRFFDYLAASWQSGMRMEITRHTKGSDAS